MRMIHSLPSLIAIILTTPLMISFFALCELSTARKEGVFRTTMWFFRKYAIWLLCWFAISVILTTTIEALGWY